MTGSMSLGSEGANGRGAQGPAVSLARLVKWAGLFVLVVGCIIGVIGVVALLGPGCTQQPPGISGNPCSLSTIPGYLSILGPMTAAAGVALIWRGWAAGRRAGATSSR